MARQVSELTLKKRRAAKIIGLEDKIARKQMLLSDRRMKAEDEIADLERELEILKTVDNQVEVAE